jgi:hypothetical protein
MENNVKVFKLITGEEVVARSKKNPDGSISLDLPLIYEPIETKQGENWSGTLVPWLKTSADGMVEIFPSHIVLEANPTREVEKHYLSALTGLTL